MLNYEHEKQNLALILANVIIVNKAKMYLNVKYSPGYWALGKMFGLFEPKAKRETKKPGSKLI